MPKYKCPKCNKKFGEGLKPPTKYCPDCKRLVKTVEDIELEEAQQKIVGPVGGGPILPSMIVLDPNKSAASAKPPVVLEGREPLNAMVVETLQSKIQRIANKKLTSAIYYSWCPDKYVDDYIDAAFEGTILQQGRKKKPSPPQGGGLYCVSSPSRSSSWAKENYVCFAVKMVNVPTICLHDKVQMEKLKNGPTSITENILYKNANVDALYLLTYGGSDGGFSRLTASEGVSITKDLISLLGEEGCSRERNKLATVAKPHWDKQMNKLRDEK